MFIIRFRNLFVSLSLALVLASALALAVFGLKPAIDFTGGTLIEIPRGELTQEAVAVLVSETTGAEASIRPTNDAFIIRSAPLSQEQITAFENGLAKRVPDSSVTRVSTIGPSLGDELFRKALTSIVLVSLGIMLFIAIAFWKVSKPVSSWVYGLVTLGTLIHDVIIPAGVFALLGVFANVEVDALFVVALLTVLGYSVNDTIVVFDRVRENLRLNQELNKHEEYERTVGKSLMQTYARSINTSLTTMLVLLALFFFGGSQTEDFALALFIGVAAGVYSSIFFAAPLLVIIERWGKKKPS